MANEAGFCSRILFSVAVQLPSKLNHKEATRWPTVHPWFTAALTNACTQPLSQLGFADQRAQSITFQKVFLSYFFPLSQEKGKWRLSPANTHSETAQIFPSARGQINTKHTTLVLFA